MNPADLLFALARLLSTSSNGASASRVPEWEGWVVLGALLLVFGALVWWLYASPGGAAVVPTGRSRMSPWAQYTLAGFVILSGLLFTSGARWDELWHRLYGGFADDFLWPPHLMIYGSLGLNSAFAGLGLTITARGSGGIRERFRANPLVGLLGLLAAFQLASIPSDLLWHKIIGPDISAWSLPHFLLMLSSSAVLLIGVALILANGGRRSWTRTGRPGLSDAAILVLIVTSTLALLQFGVTEWEWGASFDLTRGRPVWVYPVVVVAIGALEAHLVLHGLRRIGAATAAAILAAAIQWAFVDFARATLPPGPTLASHLLLVLPAVALDGWYALRLRRGIGESTLLYGALIYGAVASIEVCLAISRLMPYPRFTVADLIVAVVGGIVAAVTMAQVARVTAAWLMTSNLERPHSLVGISADHAQLSALTRGA